MGAPTGRSTAIVQALSEQQRVNEAIANSTALPIFRSQDYGCPDSAAPSQGTVLQNTACWSSRRPSYLDQLAQAQPRLTGSQSARQGLPG